MPSPPRLRRSPRLRHFQVLRGPCYARHAAVRSALFGGAAGTAAMNAPHRHLEAGTQGPAHISGPAAVSRTRVSRPGVPAMSGTVPVEQMPRSEREKGPHMAGLGSVHTTLRSELVPSGYGCFGWRAGARLLVSRLGLPACLGGLVSRFDGGAVLPSDEQCSLRTTFAASRSPPRPPDRCVRGRGRNRADGAPRPRPRGSRDLAAREAVCLRLRRPAAGECTSAP